MDHAVAYVNWGRWVADCPNPTCTNALELEVGQQHWKCEWVRDRHGNLDGCRTTAPIDWPADPAAVEQDLAARPEADRHWRPEPAVDTDGEQS